MNYQNGCDCNVGTCPVQIGSCRKTSWYCKCIKPLFTFVLSVMLALSMSYLCEKYSTSNSLQMIKSDLSTMRNNMHLMSIEVRELMDSRNDLRNKLKEVICFLPRISDAIMQLRNELSDGTDTRKGLSVDTMADNIRQMVKNELEIYDADKTGRTDFALESQGGKILSIRNTQTYVINEPMTTVMGIPVCPLKSTPETIIQAGVEPGECWAFKGTQGTVVIQLIGSVYVSGITLEHILPKISPTGETRNAPKEFSLWGLDDVSDKKGVLLGSYVYDNSGPAVQTFDIENAPNKPYNVVELKIHSNNGNEHYTCIYRVRIHGTLESFEPKC